MIVTGKKIKLKEKSFGRYQDLADIENTE